MTVSMFLNLNLYFHIYKISLTIPLSQDCKWDLEEYI